MGTITKNFKSDNIKNTVIASVATIAISLIQYGGKKKDLWQEKQLFVSKHKINILTYKL